MRKEELVSYLQTCGWKSTTAYALARSSNVDCEMSLSKWRDSFIGAFCSDHPDSGHIVRYMAEAIGKDVFDWEDITAQTMRTVRNYLSTNVTVNSAKTYLGYIKGTANLNQDKTGLNTAQLTSATRTKQTPTQHIALTEEELELIHRYQPHSKTEADVKRDFMIEAYCGARNSDAKCLTENNVDGDWITYVSKKTKTKTSVPLHRNLLGYRGYPADLHEVRNRRDGRAFCRWVYATPTEMAVCWKPYGSKVVCNAARTQRRCCACHRQFHGTCVRRNDDAVYLHPAERYITGRESVLLLNGQH